MSFFTVLAIPSFFAGITCLMHAAGSKKQSYLYAGYGLSMASVFCAHVGIM